MDEMLVVLLRVLVDIVPLPVVSVVTPGPAVLMAPHAEHDVLVVLLLLLVALLAPLVLLVLPSVLLPLVVAWLPRIGTLISKKFSTPLSKFRIISN